MMLSTIRIYGRLAKFLKRRKFEAQVSTAAEAVRFLLANFPQLEPELIKGHYRVSVGDYDLDVAELQHPAGRQEIKIVPLIAGAGAAGRIIAGVALVAAAIVLGPVAGGFAGLGLGLSGGGMGIIGGVAATLIGGIGASLILGGVAELLTPVTDISTGADGANDPKKSYSFSGIQQSSRAGVPVPIVYGETVVGSVVISAGIDTKST
jgi:predicted phage tail protein